MPSETATGTRASAAKRGNRRTEIGVVSSDKCDKTIVVVVERLTKHPRYKKYIMRRTRYYAHDEKNEARVGDRVEIGETRPLSKLKRWRLVRIVEKARQLGEIPGAEVPGAASKAEPQKSDGSGTPGSATGAEGTAAASENDAGKNK